MPDITWTLPIIPLILYRIPTTMSSLVDVGCGRGIIGALCRIYREPNRLVGVDFHKPYLKFCKKFNFYDECVTWNLEDLPLPFKNKEFEVTTCIEVIEHLPKDVGEGLLEELERIAKRIIITTPNYFFKQEGYDNNPNQKHLSLWRVKDFRRRNYRVYGAEGMKVFGRKLRYVSSALGPLTRYIPGFSTLLMCIKDVNDVKC